MIMMMINLHSIFTIIYLGQTMFLVYVVLQLFCVYSLWYMWWMLFKMLNVLNVYISAFLSLCAVPNITVFCTSLISCFPFLTNFLNDFEMVSVAPVINGVTYIFTFHTSCTSHSKVFVLLLLLIKLSIRLCLEIRTQDEVTVWRLIIGPLKGWKNSNIWEQRQQIKILFRKKLRADWR